ncbi:MAG: type II toxin-antitoxin system VapC family toxin [Chloroflexota bacterium]|nr:type II toxin-antitoxin system VapC family toxin [Chloroflexota bacterium]
MGVTEFETALSHYQSVGLDAMAFIYHFEIHPLYSPLTTFLFQHIQDGSLSALISVLVPGEVLTGPKKTGDRRLVLLYRHIFAAFPHLQVHDVDMATVELMSDLRAQYGLRTPDAIHLATTILHGGQAFITNDAQLRSEIDMDEKLDILVLRDFITSSSP